MFFALCQRQGSECRIFAISNLLHSYFGGKSTFNKVYRDMKPTYPSLFATTGFNDIDKSEIHDRFVRPFPSSVRRPMLATKLREYIDSLQSLVAPHGLNLEIWIDGSFVTEKQEPDDVDIVVSGRGCEIDTLPIMLQNPFQVLVDNNFTKVNYNCDVYFSDSDNAQNRSYWRGWFLFDREEQPKGVARVHL